MAILYADEDFSYPVVQRLRQLGHDLLTAHEAGRAGQGITDKEVLAFAIAEGRAVVTFNRRHFIRLHSEVSSHAGIIVCTRDDDVLALANRIHQQLQKIPTLQNQLLRINRSANV
jgi:predicted nuclease of predicted toxin-antitoxin system